MREPINGKVRGGGIAGGLTVIVVWAVQNFAAVDVPAEIASAFTVVVSGAVGYMVRS